MDFNDKNVEMVKMMAKIEQLETENRNIVRLLQRESIRNDDQRIRSDGKYAMQQSLTTPKRKSHKNKEDNKATSSQEYDIYKDDDGEWKEYDADDPNLEQYHKDNYSD